MVVTTLQSFSQNTMVKEEACAGVIPVRKIDGVWQILLALHVKGDYWAFPKGHIEPGENPYSTAERELFEELNLKIETLYGGHPLKEDYFFERGEDSIHKEVVYYPAYVKGELFLKEPHEVVEAKWFDIDLALKTITFDNTRKMLEPLIQSLSDPS